MALNRTEDIFILSDTNLSFLIDRPVRTSDYMIMFCRKGRAKFLIDEWEYSIEQDKSVTLLPGTVLFLKESDEALSVFLLVCSKNIFDELQHSIKPTFFHYVKHHPCYKHHGEDFAWITQILNLINSVYEDRENQHRMQILSNFMRNMQLYVYDKVQRFYFVDTDEKYTRKELIFHRFIDLILKYAIVRRDVSFYSDQLCISSTYLATVTKSVSRESPKQIIDKHVIQEIKIVLSSTDKSMMQIADEMNFPDQSYMGRYFKHYTGQSLSAYRTGIATLEWLGKNDTTHDRITPFFL